MKKLFPFTQFRKLLLVCGALAALSSARADSFTLDPTSPTLGLIGAGPADILYDVPGVGGVPGAPPPPSVGVPFPALGLVPGDVVDAISDGFDPVFLPHLNYFSVTRGSVGAAGSGVFIESSVLDTPPGATPGHAGDLFVAGLGLPVGVNILAPAGFGWTLGTTTGDEANTNLITPTLPPAAGDNVNAYDLALIAPGAATFFSLAAGSPTLGGLGATPADILAVGGGFGAVPVIFFPGLALGLPAGTDMDALAIFAPGGAFGGPGTIEYSLTAGTAGLAGVSGADILGFGPGVIIAHTAASIGLLPTDDLDALDVGQQPVPEPGTLALAAAGGLLLLRRLQRARSNR